MTKPATVPDEGVGRSGAHKRNAASIRSERAAVVRRLYSAIDKTLTKLEAAMATDEPLTPADRERETRALHTIIRNVEKVRELESGKPKPAAGAAISKRGRTSRTLARDPEVLRLELAERILRLRQRRPDGGEGTGNS